MTSKRRRWGVGMLLILALAAVLAVLWLRPGLPGAKPVPAALPVAHAPVTLLVQPDDGSRPLIQALDGARQSIRLKIYLITDQAFVDALARAVQRGVETRVLLELEPFGGGESNRLAMEAMQAAGVQVKSTPGVFTYSHEKSLVVDDGRAFILTHNLTRSSFTRNREYGVVVEDPQLVAEVAQVFDADWERRAPDLAAANLVWSPVNSRRLILALIDSAQSNLDLQETSILDDQVVARLAAAARRGLRVRLTTPAVFDPAEWEYEPLKLLQEAGVAIRFLDQPYVHAKAILADGQVALVGSQNISAGSLDQNRELGILLDDAAAINRLAGTFLADWHAATPWAGPQPTTTLPASGIVPWQDAGAYLGQTITVEGEVVDTHDSGSVVFLNFDQARSFTVVIFADDLERFPEPPEDLYWMKRVRVTGQVELYDGDPEIVVEEPGQIEIVADVGPASLGPTATLPPDGVVPWQDAAAYLGQRVTVEGEVVRTHNSGKAAFLNFAQDYEGQFSVVIFAADFDQWPQLPDQLYQGRRVRVSGKVKLYQEAPEMVVEEPGQIEDLGPAQAALLPTATALPLVRWQEAAAHEGHEITVEGTVLDSYRSDKVILLSLGPAGEDFKAVIFQTSWDLWPQSPDQLYLGRTIQVSGEVQLYQGAPEIIVRAPGQVRVVE